MPYTSFISFPVGTALSEQVESTKVSLPLSFGDQEVAVDAYAFKGGEENEELIILVHRSSSVDEEEIPLVRVHSGCVTGDIFHSLRCDCHAQLQFALGVILKSDFGVLVYAPYHEGRGIGLFKKLQTYALQEQGLDTVDANIAIGAPVDGRNYRLVVRALKHLGLSKIKLLSNNPAKVEALTDGGINVVERLKIYVGSNCHNEQYLNAKRNRMAHDY